MKIQLNEISGNKPIERLIINAHESNIYTVSIKLDGQERRVADRKGKMLMARNKLNLQALFQDFKVAKTILRHHSLQDEMIGVPDSQTSNFLEVSMGNGYLGYVPQASANDS